MICNLILEDWPVTQSRRRYLADVIANWPMNMFLHVHGNILKKLHHLLYGNGAVHQGGHGFLIGLLSNIGKKDASHVVCWD
jgi:hypothetical protein